jgi:hypothetical protein
MRQLVVLLVLAGIVVGCARDPVTPPSNTNEPYTLKSAADAWSGPYRLWGELSLYFDEGHENVSLVPKRCPRFHLNALKFLEEYCTDCLKIVGLKNNGDDTVDLTVRITHPFPGLPQYTGFDVKGIIMFNGSYEWIPPDWFDAPPLPSPCMISWRELGDPEVLNADGYAYRWSTVYDSGSDLPIFNYWKGKYASGVPNAGVNAFLNFHSDSERHMFRTDTQVTRTYKIWLPPGEPVIAGYAVEACWEPPLVTPVTNPAEDFPITANQPEPYHFKVVVNNGEPVVQGSDCCGFGPDYCSDLRLESLEWDDDHNNFYTYSLFVNPLWDYNTLDICPCDQIEDSYRIGIMDTDLETLGIHRDIGAGFREKPNGDMFDEVVDLIDYTVVEE